MTLQTELQHTPPAPFNTCPSSLCACPMCQPSLVACTANALPPAPADPLLATSHNAWWPPQLQQKHGAACMQGHVQIAAQLHSSRCPTPVSRRGQQQLACSRLLPRCLDYLLSPRETAARSGRSALGCIRRTAACIPSCRHDP